MMVKERLCIALDVPTLEKAVEVVHELAPYVGLFKIGMQLFTAEGPRAIHSIRGLGGKVFLDLKYHDIPNTVANAAREAMSLGVDVFTIHASGGTMMMRAVADALEEKGGATGRPTVLAITVLTSLSSQQIRKELNVAQTVREQVVSLARLAQAAGIHGVVASPQEIKTIRKACGKDFMILTPGIRPEWAADKADQKRIMTPAQAIRAGADYIVVGRPIRKAPDPKSAAKRICAEIEQGMREREKGEKSKGA